MAVDEGIFQNIVGVNWPSDPVLMVWDSGNGAESWWAIDDDGLEQTLSKYTKTWTGSLGGGPESFAGVPNARLADSRYKGARGFGGSETEFGGSPWANNGHNWGPYWTSAGSLIQFGDRPATGHWLHPGFTGPNRFWRGGIISLPEWSHYQVHFRLETPVEFDPPVEYWIELGNDFFGGTKETHSITAEYPDSARDLMVTEINTNSSLATATAIGASPRDLYLESTSSGYPLLPNVSGSVVKELLSGVTIVTPGPVLNWTTITETVTL